jgi:hypothetical protein
MKRMKLLGFALIALLAALAATSSSVLALAVPENLPESRARTFTGEKVGSANSLLETLAGTKIECKKGTASGNETGMKPPSGEFHITFGECTSASGECTGTNDRAGQILTLGTWLLIWDRLTPTTEWLLHTGYLFKITEPHFTCGALKILVLVRGTLICLHLNPTTRSSLHEFHCFQRGGEQEDEECMRDPRLDVCEETLKDLLLISIGGGAFEDMGILGLWLVLHLLENRNVEIFADV